jgi:hypothetical protein
MDNNQKDGSQAPQGIGDTQAVENDLDENSPLMGSGDRGPTAMGSGDSGPIAGSGDR